MFSKTCEYAIRAIIFIASNAKDDHRLNIKTIAKGIDSPEHFIAKILQDLARQGLVQSAKGPHGGFYLEEDSYHFAIADIVRAIDGDKLFESCGLGLDFCSSENPCPIHNQYFLIKEDIRTMLETTKLIAFKDTKHSVRLSNDIGSLLKNHHKA